MPEPSLVSADNTTVVMCYHCTATQPDLIEEMLWTVPGIVAIEHSVEQPGSMTIYADVTVEGVKPLATAIAGIEGLAITQCRAVEETDWANSWKQHWHITPLTPHLTIRPSWLEYTPNSPDEVVLTLDPGAAFGTGTHETTSLMAKQMDALRQQGTLNYPQINVLDVGTGSGILAIIAGLFGSRQVTGQDIDPKVMHVAHANALANAQGHIHWTDTPLGELCHTQYDLVLANILAPVIIDLLPDLALRLLPGGTLLTSGIILSAAPNVKAEAVQVGLKPVAMVMDGKWCLMQFEKPL
jgi:ribosomal protein L11 methyltransferase